MTDRMTPEQRSRCMSHVKGRDTKPEMIVRRYLFSKGLRYRVNNRRLFGTPDLSFKKYRTVVFVDGCFWHGHEGCRLSSRPKSNEIYWRQKINMNVARDYRTNVELRLAGWRVIRVWECELSPCRREETLERLYRMILEGAGQNRSRVRAKQAVYDDPQWEISAAADPEDVYGKTR